MDVLAQPISIKTIRYLKFKLIIAIIFYVRQRSAEMVRTCVVFPDKSP
jgi:hypothetical protein